MRNMKNDGKSLIIITHKLHEVLGVSDLMFMTRSVAGIYYKGTECYLIAATVYLFLTYLSSLLLKTITGRMTAPDNTKRRQGNQTVDLGLPSSN